MKIVLVGGHFDGKVVDVNPPLKLLRMVVPNPAEVKALSEGSPTKESIIMNIVEYRLFQCRDTTYIYKALQE